MKNFMLILMLGLLVASILIYMFLMPDLVKRGGPIVAGLIFLAMLSISFVIERIFTLRKAAGIEPLPRFLKKVQDALRKGDLDGAKDLCGKQRGSTANVLRAGIDRYQQLLQDKAPKEKVISETQAAIQEANALEVPLLERNLVGLATIASICTMVGLLGTTVGMIRAFAAAAQVGSVDATELAKGISEALINTAGGLLVAIFSIVLDNVFTTKVDGFNYMMDEASYETMQLLISRTSDK